MTIGVNLIETVKKYENTGGHEKKGDWCRDGQIQKPVIMV